MIKNILVCTDGSPYGDTACDYAIHLTQRLGARLIGLHALDSRMLEGPLMADISNWVGAQPYGGQLANFTQLMREKGETILTAFEERCRAAGVTAESAIHSGHPVRIILEEEARAELVVMGRKGEHAPWLGDMMGSSVERVVRHSVKPCLVVPQEFTPVTRILAAFDGSQHSSQALHEAIELAAALGVGLVMLTAAENGGRENAERISAEGVRMARAHQCALTALVPDGHPATVILQTAIVEKCDLIVMGAYGHSRIREMILGSNTNALLLRADIPVMLVR